MKKYKYIVVDDDDLDRLSLCYYLKDHPFLEYKAAFSSSEEALDYILNNDIDIAFLDIDMPGISGIEMQKQIKEKVLCTIFCTSYSEFAVEGFNLEVFDYIVKPLSKERLDISVKRLSEYMELNKKVQLFDASFKDGSVIVKEKNKSVGIRIYDIVYLEALKDYTKLISNNRVHTTVHSNIGALLRTDDFKHFIRIHKSYAIQKNYIGKITATQVEMTNGILLPVGQSYKKEFLEILSKNE